MFLAVARPGLSALAPVCEQTNSLLSPDSSSLEVGLVLVAA